MAEIALAKAAAVAAAGPATAASAAAEAVCKDVTRLCRAKKKGPALVRTKAA